MRIISITNQKGGCGKTTTAINLAASLAVNGRKTLLIDLDPQAHTTSGLNIENALSIYNVLSKTTHKKAALKDIIKNVSPNFDLAPSSIVLSTLEQELASEIGREARLLDILGNFNHNYDYILIDCPPNLGLLTINALRAADEAVIPVEASRFALEGLSQLIDILNLVRDRLSHNITHRILITNFDSRLRHSFTMLDKIRSSYKSKMFATIIHVNVKLKEAQNSGMHILGYDKYCRGAKDYFSLSREIIMNEKPATHKAHAETPMSQMEEKMQEILKKELPKLKTIIFSVDAPAAKDVYIAGEFNDWKTDESSRMNIDTKGTWHKRLNLENGSYRYRFVIDGQWIEDPTNPEREKNPYGNMDSVIKV